MSDESNAPESTPELDFEDAAPTPPAPIVAAFLNKSTLVSDSDCLKWAIACSEQARTHAAPLWGWPTPTCVFLPDDSQIKPEYDLIYLFDDSDAAGALGYHDVTPEGKPYAKIFVRDCENDGVAPSSCLSHEVLELCGDPSCDAYAPAPDGFEYALELCDAVQNFGYEIDGVAVSDFLLPAFFGDGSGLRFDYMSKITTPFQTGAGGYQIQRDPKTGNVTQVFGFGHVKMLAGKRHPAARTYRHGVR